MKTCSKCKKLKSESEFCIDKYTKDGLSCWCKGCKSNKQKIYRLSCHENIKNCQSSKKCCQCRKIKSLNNFYKDNGSPDEHQGICKQCTRDNYKRDHIKMIGRACLHQHRKKGFIVNLTIDEYLLLAKNAKVCPICGCELDWECKRKTTKISPSLDRINNEKILNKDNVMFICHQCNTTKGSRSLKEFIEYCKMIADKFK